MTGASLDLVGAIVAVGVFAIHLVTVLRAITRPNRTPASRVAWVAMIMCLPVIGVVAYLLLGETSIGRERVRLLNEAEQRLAAPSGAGTRRATWSPGRLGPVPLDQRLRPDAGQPRRAAGRSGGVPGRADARLRRRDQGADRGDRGRDRARPRELYIWLDDGNGGRVADAISAAARRGVTCRVMADALGSRDFVRGPRWRQLREAGAHLVAALEDIPRLGHFAVHRVDLRNHRKLVVIDNRIAFCGSQNCADPQFLIKAKYAPWIDVLLRCEGPVVRQAQHLFLSTWIAETGEDLYGLPAAAPEPERYDDGVVAQMYGTGPTTPGNPMSDSFVSALYAAEHELIITTPYFVPDQALLRAVCAAPRRGVETTLVLPALNDSPLVAAASRSAYPDLLTSGVRLFEYPLGLLHTKSITIDGRITLVGSANMDRRSLELNFENNLLVLDPGVTATIRDRQLGYLSQSTIVKADTVEHWPFRARLINNAIGMASPLL